MFFLEKHDPHHCYRVIFLFNTISVTTCNKALVRYINLMSD